MGVLSMLTRRQIGVLSLAVDGLSHREISERLGIGVGTVKQLARRGRLALRRHGLTLPTPPPITAGRVPPVSRSWGSPVELVNPRHPTE
jgi:transposase